MYFSIDYEKIASHISDYIENGKLFDLFAIEDIEQIMKYSKLRTEQFITLLKEYIYLYTKYMKINIFEVLNQQEKEIRDYMEDNRKLHEEIKVKQMNENVI